jgi:hypothetical protein
MSTPHALARVMIGSCGLFLFTVAADAACQGRYRLNTSLTIDQANGFTTECTLEEFSATGPRFRGNCTAKGKSGATLASKSIEGFIQDNARFHMRVTWHGGAGSVGVYTGAIVSGSDPTRGRIEDGRTFDETHPERWSKWTARQVLFCIKI